MRYSGTLLLAPHNDDEALFASFLCLRHSPEVLVVFQSRVQEQYGVTAEERTAETMAAMEILGCPTEQWNFSDLDPSTASLYAIRNGLVGLAEFYDHCFAPAIELEGHAQHNIIGQLARETFGDRVTHYMTYTRHGGRSCDGELNEPDDFSWIGLKMQALACYRSQLRVNNCRPWFYDQLDLREWIANAE